MLIRMKSILASTQLSCDAEIITPAENERLSTVSDQIEELAADRAIALVELATLRQVSLMEVMHDLGIVGAGVR